ncbi:MAG: CapA family protein [Planctomycetota bacterium]|jgi:poly-gamma-glutamate synthesis protein (capsule biosynthesis protein)
MLGRLARWLRVLGFDAAYETQIADAELVRRALDEQRAILTRDRRLPEERRCSSVLVLDADDTREQLREVLDGFNLWPHLQPFTRCNRCNVTVRPVTAEEVSHRVPPAVRARVSAFTQCPQCARVYWHGSHTGRVLRILDQIRPSGEVDRRRMLGLAIAATLGALVPRKKSRAQQAEPRSDATPGGDSSTMLFLCGDVMTGRGIDQVLPHAGDPRLYEQTVRDARRYVRLAERVNGPISQPVDYAYIWGDALADLARARPHARIINLETAVTTSNDRWVGKGINYRMHPGNIPCLTAAGIDCCALANNHVLDWGEAGLVETLRTLEQAGLKPAGAGRNIGQAEAPAIIELPENRRVIVFSYGTAASGIPPEWTARDDRIGVSLLRDLSPSTVQRIAGRVQAVKRPGDVVVASLHWGGNWGYAISDDHRAFARKLIDAAGIDLIHGHSSHHPKGIEVYRGKLILYGCGDFINDYEGIDGRESFRDELGFMYFPILAPETGRLRRLRLVPTRRRRFQVLHADPADAQWLFRMMNREGEALGTRVVKDADGAFLLRWT